MFYKKNLQVNEYDINTYAGFSFSSKELSTKTVESISTASSSNESFQKEDGEVECEDNRYIYILNDSSLEDKNLVLH